VSPISRNGHNFSEQQISVEHQRLCFIDGHVGMNAC